MIPTRCIAAAAVLAGAAAAAGQSTERASAGPGGADADGASRSALLSADGRFVAFRSEATNLVPGDGNGVADVFVLDRWTGAMERASVSSSGAQGDLASHRPAISADGRFVAFASDATNLVPGDGNGVADVFLRDRATLATLRVSVSSSGLEADLASFRPSISADGRLVAFASDATNLVPGDVNGLRDCFVRDTSAGRTARVSLAIGGSEGDAESSSPVLSADGRFVAFTSRAGNLVAGDTNGRFDAFVRDLATGATLRASVASDGTQGDGDSYAFSLTADGGRAAFWSLAGNLVPGDTNLAADAFVRDLAAGSTARASLGPLGAQGDGPSYDPVMSSDGRCVAFASRASNLVPGDGNGALDVFLRDLLAGTTAILSVDASGVPGDQDSQEPSLSADGRIAAFWSDASSLVPSDANGLSDVFVRDRGAGAAFGPLCPGDGTAAACPCGNSGSAGRGCENSAGTGGALLAASGSASLAADLVQLAGSGLAPSAGAVVLQGSAAVAPVSFGDGLRCAGGFLARLYVKTASGGAIAAPGPGDPSISARSAALGDPIPLGATRVYQVHYRDPSPGFCPGPAGGTFNASSALAIAWGA